MPHLQNQVRQVVAARRTAVVLRIAAEVRRTVAVLRIAAGVHHTVVGACRKAVVHRRRRFDNRPCASERHRARCLGARIHGTFRYSGCQGAENC